MATKKPQPRGLHFGEKVSVILKRNAAEGLEPSTPKALADRARETHPRVYRALKSHDPKLRMARKIARVLGESLDFLADPDRDFRSRTPGERWDSFVSTLSPEERDAIAETLSRSSDVRRLLLAYADRARSGPGGPTATPTESRP